jgi:two-component system sensor histidine kinase KdpD
MNRFYQNIKLRPYGVSIALIGVVTLVGLGLHDLVGYRVVAFMLLVSVSILALLYDIIPVIAAAIGSALIWDLLFIPPRFTFTIASTEDQLLLLTYFVVAIIHAVLTMKIRREQKLAREKEAKASQLKFYNALLNSLSHELRTPITTILGATDNLLANKSSTSDKDKEELLQGISTAALRLNQQVENLLSMSRLESGVFKIKPDWVDVRELIYTTVQRLEPGISKYRLSIFIPETMPLVKLDVGIMEQVLYNLLNNILQHTPEGTDIIVNANYDDNELMLSISDTGKGFPEAEIHRVFDKFYRVNGSKPGGTGLGLSIVKGFVEAHHGTVTLRNLPLSGAEFTITIPSEASYLSGLKNE